MTMRQKMGYFSGGVLFSLVAAVLISMYNNPFSVSNHFADEQKNLAYMTYLFDNDVRFSCEVDPLFRLRVTPFIDDPQEVAAHKASFSAQYQAED